MRGNCNGFQPSLVFHTIGIHFGQNNSQRDTFIGADILHGHIQLCNAAQRFQCNIPKVHDDGIFAAVDLEVYRNGTRLRIDHNATIHCDDRRGERNRTSSFRIRIGDGLVYKLHSRGLRGVLDEEFR